MRQNEGFRMQDTRFMIQDSGCKIQDARFRITDKKTIMHRVSCIMHRKSRASCIMHRDSKGFTLIETIMVMVIAVILAAVVAVRWSPFDTIKLNSATRKVAADIRYAQKVAISTQTRAAIIFISENGYEVFQDITVPTRALSPGDPCSTDSFNDFVVAFNDSSRCGTYSGVTIPTNPLTIAFDSLGKPVDGGGGDLATQTVTVSYKGTTKSITIEAGTGRVEIQN